MADHAGGRVDGEIYTRFQHHRSDQRHHRHERLHYHAPVAYQPRVALVLQHFRSSARRDQRMEPGNRTARDRDKRKWKYLAPEYRTVAVNESSKRRHQSHGMERNDPDCERDDSSNLDEGGKIIA